MGVGFIDEVVLLGKENEISLKSEINREVNKEEEFTLETLKNSKLNGYIIFTDAAETGEKLERGWVIITSNTKPEVDMALMDAGFYFEDNRINNPSQGLYWMKRGEKENLRYHPIKDKDFPLIKLALSQGMKTRIDFFCGNQKSNAAYDVINELLKLGYKVMVFPPKGNIISRWFLLQLKENQIIAEEVKEK